MTFTEELTRPSALALAALLLLVTLVPIFARQKASAYNLATSRIIKLSSSVNAATDVIYSASFATATTSNVGGAVIDFCSNSPIIGDTCTAPGGTFNVNKATLALANQVGITDFAVDTTNSSVSKVVLTRTAASVSSGVTISFDLGTGAGTSITNPSTTNTTFYARILTYATTAAAQGYTSISVGAPVDAGGVALSTTAQVTITAKVQERLTFCVYTSAVNYANCTAVSGTTVALGDANGVLIDTGAFVDIKSKYNVSTNASNGVTIRAKGATLTSGSNTIAGIGATATASTTGTEQYGFCTYRDTGGGSAGLTPAAPYNNASCSSATQTAGTGTPGGDGGASFALDTTTGGNNLSTTYGNTIATKTAGAQSTGIIVFIGNIATVTKPGIYTSTMTFIATGNY